MKRTKIGEKEYAKICLECPRRKCVQDGWGQCDRIRPYKTEVRRDYAKEEDEEKRQFD